MQVLDFSATLCSNNLGNKGKPTTDSTHQTVKRMQGQSITILWFESEDLFDSLRSMGE